MERRPIRTLIDNYNNVIYVHVRNIFTHIQHSFKLEHQMFFPDVLLCRPALSVEAKRTAHSMTKFTARTP